MTSLGVQRGWICLCNFSASIAHELCERTCSTWQNASRRKSLEVSCSLVTKQLYMSCLTSVSFLRFVHHDSLKPICAFPHSCQVSCALQTTWLQTKGPRDRKAQDECTAGPSKSYLKPMWQIVRKSCNFVHLLQTHLTAANPAFLWFLMDINEFGQGYWLDLSVPRCSMLGQSPNDTCLMGCIHAHTYDAKDHIQRIHHPGVFGMSICTYIWLSDLMLQHMCKWRIVAYQWVQNRNHNITNRTRSCQSFAARRIGQWISTGILDSCYQ
jgi:hypothetical protein